MTLNSFCMKWQLRLLCTVPLVLCAGLAGATEAKRNPAPVVPATQKGAPAPARVQPSAPTDVLGRAPLPPRPAQPRMGGQERDGVEKVAPGIYRLGEISIDKRQKGISFPAKVNMDKGLLEYLLVRDGGKTHESLLRTAVAPIDLQVALLLVGLEGADEHQAAQGDPGKPGGERVEISLTYPDAAGKAISVGPQAWIARKTGEKLAQADKFSWVFTGSMIRDQRFLAQAEGSIIAVYHDPVALVDNTSAGAESDLHWFVNEKSVPRVGTPVTVTIRAAK